MKLLVDIEELQAQGTVTPEQAAAIRRLAGAETMSFAVNAILALGVIAVVVGVVTLQPGTLVMAVLGGALVAAGLFLRPTRAESFSFLGGALLLVGAIVLAHWREHRFKERFGAPKALFGEHDRLRLAAGVGNHALPVQPAQSIPVKPFPRTDFLVQSQVEEGQSRFVNPFSVDRHG